MMQSREEMLAQKKVYNAAHAGERNARQKQYAATHKEEKRAYDTLYATKHRRDKIDRALRLMYGISADEYDDILASQGGVCKICGARHSRDVARRLGVDHDHKTGKVRGILCSDCNAGLGNFRDDISILASAALYLRGVV